MSTLKGERHVLVKEFIFAADETRSSKTKKAKNNETKTTAASHDPIFDALKQWRTEQAKTTNVPPYVIMHDSTLIALAQAKPQTEDDLIGIAGMGEKRRVKYGHAIVEIVRGL